MSADSEKPNILGGNWTKYCTAAKPVGRGRPICTPVVVCARASLALCGRFNQFRSPYSWITMRRALRKRRVFDFVPSYLNLRYSASHCSFSALVRGIIFFCFVLFFTFCHPMYQKNVRFEKCRNVRNRFQPKKKRNASLPFLFSIHVSVSWKSSWRLSLHSVAVQKWGFYWVHLWCGPNLTPVLFFVLDNW